MEQHANLISAEQIQAGLINPRKRIKYELSDAHLQQLASRFNVIERDLYLKRTRPLFNFLYECYLNEIKLFSHIAIISSSCKAQLSGHLKNNQVFFKEKIWPTFVF